MPERNNEQLARDLEMHAKSISEIVQAAREQADDINSLLQQNAVRIVEDRHRDEKISSILSLGRVALVAIITLFIGAVFAALKSGLFNV